MRLVQFSTHDELRLNGLLAVADQPSGTTVIHIHGKTGNFYENKFVRIMYDRFPELGLNFLGFNNRGHSSYTEAYRGGSIDYIGTAVEEFTECLLDLRAAVEFALGFSDKVVIQGHSFGCEKAMYYAHAQDPEIPIVLLSPSDGYRLQQVYIAPESVESQIGRLASLVDADPNQWLPPNEYGIRANGLDYHVPITARALLRLLAGPAFQILRADMPWEHDLIANPSFVYLGSNDALQVDGIDAMVGLVRSRIRSPEISIYQGADHHLRPVIDAVIADVASWALRAVLARQDGYDSACTRASSCRA